MVCETQYKECEVVIKIPKTTKEAHKHIFNAIRELREAGIQFDTGYGPEAYDMEFDWSLSGATVYFKRFKDEV